MSVGGHILLFGWAFVELGAAEFDPWAQETRQPAFGGVQGVKQQFNLGRSEA